MKLIYKEQHLNYIYKKYQVYKDISILVKYYNWGGMYVSILYRNSFIKSFHEDKKLNLKKVEKLVLKELEDELGY